MSPPHDTSCKICDIPPKEICKNCGYGICCHPNCCLEFNDMIDNKKCVSFICIDCVTTISSSLKQLVSTHNDCIGLEICAQSK